MAESGFRHSYWLGLYWRDMLKCIIPLCSPFHTLSPKALKGIEANDHRRQSRIIIKSLPLLTLAFIKVGRGIGIRVLQIGAGTVGHPRCKL